MRTILPISFLLLLLLGVESIAQNTDSSHRYELSGLTLSQPDFIGKVGTHYMLLDRKPERDAHVALYILDSNKQFERKIYLPAYAVAARRNILGNRLRLTYFARKPAGSPSSVYLMQVTETGEYKDLGVIHPDPSILIPTITSNRQTLQLIYSFYSLGDSGIFFTGMLIDSTGSTVKTLGYRVDFDPDFNQQPQVILDSKGNIHVLVMERLSSYRMSAAVSINTIPFDSEEMTSETFRFERVKFHRLILSDNPGKELVQLQGFYYDGQAKNSIKGLVSLQLPYTRGKQPNSQFNLLPDQLRAQLRKNMVHLHRKDDVMTTLYINNAVSENGETLLSFWARDIAEFEHPSEFDADQNREKNWKNVVKARHLPDSALRDLYVRWLNGANVQPVSTDNFSTTYTSFKNTFYYELPVAVNPSVASTNNLIPPMIDRRFARKRNLVSFQLNAEGKFTGYSIIFDRFIADQKKINIEGFNFPLVHQNGYSFATNGWMDFDAVFSLLQPNGVTDPGTTSTSHALPLSTFVSTPVRTGDNTYAWLIKKAPSNGGGLSLLEYTFQ